MLGMVSYSRRQKSGHFTCYLNRTYHVLLTEKQQPLALLLCHCYCGGMARNTNNLRSLRNIIAEAHDILRTTILPEQRSQRAYELLTAAVHLADNLLEESPAAALGAKGGKITAKRGSEYFRQIAAKRKTRAGGRPTKEAKPD